MPIIDTLVYLVGRQMYFPGEQFNLAAETEIETMRELGISRAIAMPWPFAVAHPALHDFEQLAGAVATTAGQISFGGGGGLLNLRIQSAIRADQVTSKAEADFRAEADRIAAAGAKCFGEIGLERLSLNKDEPYVSAAPDHPLVLLLADIAAEKGLPVVVHMEAVAKDYELPKVWAARTPNNPESLSANIEPFKRMLARNRKARIVWTSAGWDNTGVRTVPLSRELLAANANLFMSIRIDGLSKPETRPLDARSRLKSEWLDLFQEFPDRFMIGNGHLNWPSMQRLTELFRKGLVADPTPGRGLAQPRALPKSPLTRTLVDQLPSDLAPLIGHRNAERVFGLPSS
ncbi:MAG: hypothetical protein EXQ89_03045 [Rhodospirillaceae bacterium]|nr:hypothetical protein [Rhodospirillaceae bacterium]